MDIVYYTTKFLVRWDMIAYQAYGDANRMTDLQEANPDLPLWNWLPIGTVVACPILLDAASNPLNTLPSWKLP